MERIPVSPGNRPWGTVARVPVGKASLPLHGSRLSRRWHQTPGGPLFIVRVLVLGREPATLRDQQQGTRLRVQGWGHSRAGRCAVPGAL